MNLLETIKNRHEEYSKSENKVASYILKYPAKVESYTITKLADAAHASTGAILRFCKILGYQGYKDFRFEMINYLHSQQQQQNQNTLVKQNLSNYEKVINQFQKIDNRQLAMLAQALTNCHLNHLIGIHYSALPAQMLAMGLTDLGYASLFAGDYMQAEHTARVIDQNATVVLFSICGNKKEFVYFLSEFIQDLPVNSFLITLNPRAELKNFFPNQIILPGQLYSKHSIVDLQTIPLMYVEILLNYIYESKS